MLENDYFKQIIAQAIDLLETPPWEEGKATIHKDEVVESLKALYSWMDIKGKEKKNDTNY